MITAKEFPPKIMPIWQPVGYSTYQITMSVAQKFGVKTAQSGVLDPLAEGVIIVLLDEERFNKIDYAGWPKTYEFEITFGLRTDSYDGLGLVNSDLNLQKVEATQIKNVLQNMEGPYVQTVPLYSAKKINGKRLFEYPKQKLDLPKLPTKSGQIYEIELLSTSEKNLHSVIDATIAKIKLVKHGQFRQTEVIKAWEAYKNSQNNVVLQQAQIRVQLSRGMYVRSLAQDIASSMGTFGFVTQLIRTKNGNYSFENCYKLSEVCDTLA